MTVEARVVKRTEELVRNGSVTILMAPEVQVKLSIQDAAGVRGSMHLRLEGQDAAAQFPIGAVFSLEFRTVARGPLGQTSAASG